MRELTTMEIDAVAGAGFFSRIGAGAMGVVFGLSAGTMKGGIAGGSVGGILGVGAVSALVTMVWGGFMGAIQGGLYGLVNDWDQTLKAFNASSDQLWDYSNVPSANTGITIN